MKIKKLMRMTSFKPSPESQVLIQISYHTGIPFSVLAEEPQFVIDGYIELMKQEKAAQDKANKHGK